MSVKEYDKYEIDKFLSAEFSKDGEKVMEIMAVPNPRAYMLKPKDIEETKHLSIGIEDGWIDGSTDEAMEKYQEAKEALSQYDFIKTIKSDAYKEFATKLKLHRRKMSSSDFSGEFWDYAVLEESIDSTLKELEDKL